MTDRRVEWIECQRTRLAQVLWGVKITRELVERSKEQINLSLELLERSELAILQGPEKSVHSLTQANEVGAETLNSQPDAPRSE